MQLPPLSEEGIKQMLTEPRVAELATLSADGEIRMTPIWYEAQDDGSILMNTWENTAAARNIKRNPKCSLMVDQAESFPYWGVHFSGTATVEGPGNDEAGIARMFAPYMGGDKSASTEYAKQLISWGKRINIRFRPEKTRSWDFRQG